MIEVETLADLNNVLAGGKPVVLKFHAGWCGPCKQLAPVVDGLATKYPEITFIAADADIAEEIVSKYEITGLPSVAFFDSNGLSSVLKGASAGAVTTTVEELASLANL